MARPASFALPLLPGQLPVALALAAPSTATRAFSLWPGSKPSPAQAEAPTHLASEGSQPGSPPADTAVSTSGPGVVAADPVSAPLMEVDPIEGAGAESVPLDLTTEFAAAGLPNGWATVPTMQTALEGAMQMTGLPWWGVIVGAVVGLKVLTLPVAIKGMRSTVKMQEMTPRMTQLMEELKAVKRKGEPTAMKEKQAEVAAAMKEANPMAPLMPMFITAPLFVTLFFALDKMAHAGLWSMTHGGALWFPDLTEPDPYVILPIISAVGQMTSSELGFANQAQAGPAAKYAGTTKTAMRIGMIASPLLTRNFPAAVLLMWATNAFLTAAQTFILSRPSVKTLLGIAPKQPAASQQPQPDPQEMAKLLKARIQREQRTAATAKLMNPRAAPAPSSKKSKSKPLKAASKPASSVAPSQKPSARRPPSKVAGRQ